MMDKITIRKWCIDLHPKEKFSDPRICQVDVSTDLVDTSEHDDKSIHSNRVMPMKNFTKFVSILRRSTKTFKGLDDSHFWVSGYYALHFYLKSKNDRKKIKSLVRKAFIESGECMSFDDWYVEHNKGRNRILQFNGTGSGITNTYNNITNHIQFL